MYREIIFCKFPACDIQTLSNTRPNTLAPHYLINSRESWVAHYTTTVLAVHTAAQQERTWTYNYIFQQNNLESHATEEASSRKSTRKSTRKGRRQRRYQAKRSCETSGKGRWVLKSLAASTLIPNKIYTRFFVLRFVVVMLSIIVDSRD